MSLHSVAVATAAVLFATMAHAQAPSKFNSVWGVDDQNDVFRWNVSESEFVRMSGIALKAGVGRDRRPGMGHRSGRQCPPLERLRLGADRRTETRADLGERRRDVGVSATEALFRWNGSTWEALYDPEQKLKAIKQVSLGFDGSRWAIVRLMFASGIPEGYVWISPATPEWLDGDHEPAEFKLPLLPNEAVELGGWASEEDLGSSMLVRCGQSATWACSSSGAATRAAGRSRSMEAISTWRKLKMASSGG